MPSLIDRTGDRYGRLAVISQAGRTPWGNVRWLCKCDCGNAVEVNGSSLARGDTRSCGCLHAELNAIARHGMTHERTWRSWQAMKQRCLNPSNPNWPNYGGRGISICPQWVDSFENFVTDMGVRPPGQTLDRIDNEGNYEPANCRWATPVEQNNNRRRRATH